MMNTNGMSPGDTYTYGNVTRMPEQKPIKETLNKFIRNWYWIALSVGLCGFAAWTFLASQSNIYLAKASFLLDEKTTNINNAQVFMKETEFFDEMGKLEDEISLLQSRTLVIDALHSLHPEVSYYEKGFLSSKEISRRASPVMIELDSTHLQLINQEIELSYLNSETYTLRITADNPDLIDPMTGKIIPINTKVEHEELVKVGDRVDNKYIGLTLMPGINGFSITKGEFAFRINSEFEQVQKYQKGLKVEALDDDANVVSLSFSGPFKDQNMDFLENLIVSYIDHANERKSKEGKQAVEFLDKELFDLSDSLKQSEDELEKFRKQNGVVDLASSTKYLNERFISMEEKEVGIKQQLVHYEYLLDNMRKPNGNGNFRPPSSENLNDPLLTALLQDYSRLNREKTELSHSATDNNPQYLILQGKIKQNRVEIQDNITNRVNALRVRLGEVRKSKIRAKGRISQLPSYEKELTQLERNYTSIAEMYKYMKEKRAEAGLALSNQSVENYIIDPPHLAAKKPISPNRFAIMFMGLLLGLVLPIGVILAKDMLSTSIITEKDIKRSTPIPVIGSIVKSKAKQGTIINHGEGTALAESFRSLRVRLRYLAESFDKNIVGVTSSLSGEGKSFCSANLGVAFSMVGAKTLVIDLDMRKPSQQDYFPGNYPFGLYDYLMHHCKREEIIYPTQINRLDFIPVGKACGNPLDFLESQKFRFMLYKLKEEYDYIVLDTPPLGLTSDYLMINPFVDQTIYIVRQNYTEVQALDQINELFLIGKMQNLGIVVNAINDPASFQYGGAVPTGVNTVYYGEKEATT